MNGKGVRSNLSKLLDKVERGEEIIITRYGQKLAQLISSERSNCLPNMKDFCASLRVAGRPLSKAESDVRDKERY
ncbi:MAG: type II toxin-antitoxin system prevent-host-death family antitoxin [Desulfobacterales bacterium]|jgi:prevent-host-death family protein